MENCNSFTCPICGNKDSKYIGIRNNHKYCRKCLTFRGQEANSNFFINTNAEYSLSYQLTDDQLRLSHKLVENFKKGKDSLVQAVCGSGKTEIVLEVIKYAISNRMKVGFAVPRRDVIKELHQRFKSIFTNNRVGVVYGGHTSRLNADLICITTHQLYRYRNYFDLLIVDEVDAFPYNGNDVLEAFLKYAVRGQLIMMSATPPKNVIEEFSKEGKDILRLNTRFHGHPLPVPRLEIHRGLMKYFYLVRELRAFLAKNKPVFVFAPTIDICEQTYEVLKIFFPNINYVHSKKEDRSEVIEAFRNKKYKVLVTTAVLERGVTVKDLQVIIFQADHAIYSSQALIQISGRVGRKKDAPTGDVVFIADKKTNEMEICINEIKRANSNL